MLSEWDKLKISNRSPEEERVFADAIASVRSHARYVDPYEQWQSETRRNAFVCEPYVPQKDNSS